VGDQREKGYATLKLARDARATLRLVNAKANGAYVALRA
jgi:hypothetical protein